MFDRRQVLGTIGAAGAFASMFPRVAFASAPTDKRLVVIMLRGAMDGLYAVPAYGDPDFYTARNGIGVPKPGEKNGALKLDSFFGLHPNLVGMQSRFAKGELVVFHAISSPYRDRSHFDGQNLLENGSSKPYGLPDGWLNRSLLGLPTVLSANRPDLGVALSPTMPLMMRGPAHVTSWSPSSLPEPDADIVGRLQSVYNTVDPQLAAALAGAAEAHIATTGSKSADANADPFVVLMAATAKFLTASGGPCVAMVDSGGWDSHANQDNPFAIPSNLNHLDQGIEALAAGMGDKWNNTAVLIMTEFGRTVAMNGTQGTDHGTGGASFLVGGAVKGGRVIADWPGLKPANLYEGRDLMPTNNLHAVAKGLLRDHMQIEPAHIDKAVFPDSAAVRPMDGLLRV